MEPKMEQPKQYTPEEIAELEKSRTISNAGLLKGGAEYVVDGKSEKGLDVTKEQRELFEEIGGLTQEEQLQIEKNIEILRMESVKMGDGLLIEYSGYDHGEMRWFKDYVKFIEIKGNYLYFSKNFDNDADTMIDTVQLHRIKRIIK